MRTTEFKDTELGPIPKVWEVKRVGECATLKAGTAYNFHDIHVGAYPCYGGNGVRCFINEYSHDGTFPIIGRQGELCGNVRLASGRFYATEHAVVASCDKGLVPEFAYYIWLRANFRQYASGCAQPGLSVAKINGVRLPYPPLPEQRRIAAALGDVDKLIENLKKRVEKKKNLKRGAMQELLTGKRRLKGFTGAWVEKRLGEIETINPSGAVNYDEFYYVDLESVKAGRLLQRQLIKRELAPSRAQRLFVKGDILFQTVRPYQKNNLFVDFDSEKYVASTGYAVLRSIDGVSDSAYIYHYVSFDPFVSQVLDNCAGTSYPAINPNKLSQMTVCLPCNVSEQRAIAAVLSDMDAEIANLESKLKKMTLLKQGMMQDLLTGKVRLV